MSGNPGAPVPPPAPRYRSVGYLPKLEGPVRERALADPGPSWREWLTGPFAKVWLALGFFIVDSWIVVLWSVPLDAAALGLTLVVAFYLEFLLWRYLWFAPDRDDDLRNLPFRPSWTQPVRFGRWTPQAGRLRAGQDPYDSHVLDDLSEFVGEPP
jgi:hypothetical protein